MSTQYALEPAVDPLWELYTAHPDGRLREEIISAYRYLVHVVLRHLGRRGDEDLEQVALLALVKAVDRFDPTRGHRFTTFAFPTILGAVKRYLRDQAHLVRPPRPLIDRRVAVLSQQTDLTARLGRSPTVEEIAETLALDVDEVVEAMALEETCHPRSLDGLMESVERERPSVMEACLGEEDLELVKVEERIAWSQALDELDPRLRRIIRLRYYGNLSQQEAAQELGISQMHVSRLERRALDQLRTRMAIAC